ncbi:MAG: C39 family peptidase [Phycisphaerae bacterium]
MSPFVPFIVVCIIPTGQAKPPADAAVNTLRSGPYALHRLIFVQDRRRGINRFEQCEGSREAACRISPPIATGFPFNELIPSWNLDVSREAAYRIELRVGRGGAAWSPWYCFAQRGPWPKRPDGDEVDPVEDDWGELRTDYLICRSPVDHVQVRLTSRPGAAGRPVTIARFAICYSNTLNDKSLWAANRMKPRRVDRAAYTRRLDVPFQSQHVADARLQGNICSPASVAMVLAFRGADAKPDDVARAAYDAEHDIYGNWPLNVQAAYEFGAPGYVTRFGDWPHVEAVIAAGQPIIASIRDPEGKLEGTPYPNTTGHLLVICGFDENGDVLVNDSAGRDAESGRLTYDRRQFERAWIDNGGVAYILEARPR